MMRSHLAGLVLDLHEQGVMTLHSLLVMESAASLGPIPHPRRVQSAHFRPEQLIFADESHFN